MQLTKNIIKTIKSLDSKKHRESEKLFVAEGSKNVIDFIKTGLIPTHLCAYPDWILENNEILKGNEDKIFEIGETEMKKISFLNTPSPVLATFPLKKNKEINFNTNEKLLILFLDNIQDPGNLGTLLRTADWFGIKNIICSDSTVDCYNPKVVQASMGSLARVDIQYTDSPTFFENLPENIPILGAYMDGKSITNFKFPQKAILVIGNEGKGISEQTSKHLTEKISIPKPINNQDINSLESLNASIAGAIICYEFSKQTP